jgi:CheY-like chemotaxis protein
MNDLLSEFLTEMGVSLGVLEAELRRLAADPDARAPRQTAFRVFKSLEASCGLLGYPRLERIAAAAGGLLAEVHRGETLTPAGVSLLRQSLIRCRELYAALALTGHEPHGRDDALLDAYASLAPQADPVVEPDAPAAPPRRVLLVGDDVLFRGMMASLLDAAGYTVAAAASPEEAWRLHEEGAEFDAVIAAFDGSLIDGFAFARRLSETSRWAAAPRIALTGVPVEDARNRAFRAAFDGVVRRSDREGLIGLLETRLGAAA